MNQLKCLSYQHIRGEHRCDEEQKGLTGETTDREGDDQDAILGEAVEGHTPQACRRVISSTIPACWPLSSPIWASRNAFIHLFSFGRHLSSFHGQSEPRNLKNRTLLLYADSVSRLGLQGRRTTEVPLALKSAQFVGSAQASQSDQPKEILCPGGSWHAFPKLHDIR